MMLLVIAGVYYIMYMYTHLQNSLIYGPFLHYHKVINTTDFSEK